jgi:hypothetical protein
MDDKPIKALDMPASAEGDAPALSIPRRKKSAVEPVSSNGHLVNGKRPASDNIENSDTKKRRTLDQDLGDDVSPSSKQAKNESNTNGPAGDDDLIFVDDSGDGAIVIDDD